MSKATRTALPIAEQMTPTRAAVEAETEASAWAWWTVERGLYAAALLAGLALRVWQLGNAPLSAWEANNVWPAWLAAQGTSIKDAPLPNSPLLHNLHWLTFWLGVQGDAATRWVSALAGATLVITPWWLRGWIGRRAALAAAVLFAVDPWLALFGRMADGGALALLLGMGALAGLLYLAQARPAAGSGGARTAVAICVGLLVVSGPMGWNMLPVVALGAWLYRRELAHAGCRLREMAVVAAMAGLAGGTLFLVRLDGLAWLSGGLSVWWAQFDGQPAGPLLPTLAVGYGMGWPWLRLVVDAPLAGLLGAAGLVVLWTGTRRRDALLMTGWLTWGILLWLAPGRSPLALPVAGLALNLLAATTVTRLAQRPPEVLWREAGAVWLTLAIMVASGLVQATTFGSIAILDARLGQTVLVVAALIVAIVVAYGFWAGRYAAAWIGVVFTVVALGLLTVKSSAALIQEQVAHAPFGWQIIQTDPEVRRLAADIETLSVHDLGDATEQAVQVQVAAVEGLEGAPIVARPDPVLGWYLRNMRRLTWVAGPQVVEEAPPPLVVMVNGESFTGGDKGGYIGSEYDLEVYWNPDAFADAGPAEGDAASGAERLWPVVRTWWRWWMYGETSQRPDTRIVTLWAPVYAATAQ